MHIRGIFYSRKNNYFYDSNVKAMKNPCRQPEIAKEGIAIFIN